MPPVSTDTITVLCSCGKKLKAPASAAGKKAKCPACGNVMKIEAPAASTGAAPVVPPVSSAALEAAKAGKTAGAVTAKKAAAPPPPPIPADDHHDGGDDLGGLYELAAVEKQARSAGAVDDSPRCPKCFTELPSGAVLCTSCGFDLRARKQITTQKGDPKPQPAKGGGVLSYGGGKAGKKDKMAPQGSFLVGIACCLGFALGGALLWFLLEISTGIWTAYCAMGVGALAGVGMQIGQKGYSKLGGWVAVAATFVSIIIANVAIGAWEVTHIKIPGQTKQTAKLEDQEKKLSADESKYDERVLEQFREEYRKAHPAVAGKADTSADTSDSADGDDSGDEGGRSFNRLMRDEINERQAAVDKVKAMPKADYDALIAKLDEKDEREELIEHLTQEEIAKRGVSRYQSSYEDHLKASHDIAQKQVDGMTRDQVKAALGPRQEKAKAEAKQQMENFEKDMKDKGLDDDAKGAAARTGVFLIILLLIFGWRTILFVILGMAFAYRTASGGVSG